jgi:prepilin-type processing-associated H-X9-DG protein
MGQSESILAGDRNIAAAGGTSGPLNWTHELHDGQGNVLFGDARAELMTGMSLQGALASSKTIPLFVVPSSETGRGEGLLPGSGARGNTANGPGTVSSGSFAPGGSDGPAGGAIPGTAIASTGNAGGGKALDRFEQLFQGPPGSKPSVAARTGGSGQAEASSGGGTLPVTVVVEKVDKLSMSTNGQMQSLPEATSGDPWAISFGQLLTRIGSRGTWWLLLFLLAALITVEVIRRRRARNKAKS